jgi:hypothetical protein
MQASDAEFGRFIRGHRPENSFDNSAIAVEKPTSREARGVGVRPKAPSVSSFLFGSQHTLVVIHERSLGSSLLN